MPSRRNEHFEIAHADLYVGTDEVDALILDAPWTAIDVYVNANGDAGATGLVVNVYGSTEGVLSDVLFTGALVSLSGDHPVHGVGGKAPGRFVVRVRAPAGPTTSRVRVAAIAYGEQPS